jgi:hypothetical protein
MRLHLADRQIRHYSDGRKTGTLDSGGDFRNAGHPNSTGGTARNSSLSGMVITGKR